MNDQQQVDMQLLIAHEKSHKVNRMLFVMAVILGGSTIALSVVLSSLFPLKEIKPYYVPISKEGRLLAYQMLSVEELSSDVLRELSRDYLKRYVIDRHTVVYGEQALRFKRVKAMTYGKHYPTVEENYRKFVEKNPDYERDVIIESDEALAGNVHQVNLTFVDSNGKKEIKTPFMATIKYTIAGITAPAIKLDAREMANNPNPLGLTVIGYKLRPRVKNKEVR